MAIPHFFLEHENNQKNLEFAMQNLMEEEGMQHAENGKKEEGIKIAWSDDENEVENTVAGRKNAVEETVGGPSSLCVSRPNEAARKNEKGNIVGKPEKKQPDVPKLNANLCLGVIATSSWLSWKIFLVLTLSGLTGMQSIGRFLLWQVLLRKHEL